MSAPSANRGQLYQSGQNYNHPDVDGSNANAYDSDVGKQFRTDYYQKKALIEARKEQYFGQMSDTVSMPKHMGKTIKRFHYVPLLDDANINSQGIDVLGIVGDGTAAGTVKATVTVVLPDVMEANMAFTLTGGDTYRFTAEDAVTATAEAAAMANADAWAVAHGYADAAAIATAGGTVRVEATVPYGGNLYGSSKDVGTINSKMPALTENGGRVNRVGFSRKELQGSIEKFGFFDEYTQESLDFDSDSELMMHINREMINGANEITEDLLQIDLLNSAGVIRFGGTATATVEINGEAGTESLITYEQLMKLSIDLDNNRCPKNTKLISGTRMIDTKVIYGARYIYIGSELIPNVRRMTDLFGNPAFIPTQQYAAAGGSIATGEIGSVEQFRIIVVPEMMHWAGAGAAETVANAGYRATSAAYDVFPMLVVGSESFVNIGFQTSGKTVKFKIVHKRPGTDIADRNDPYGETGFMSIKWYYGFMLLRPERIALCKTIAEW